MWLSRSVHRTVDVTISTGMGALSLAVAMKLECYTAALSGGLR